MAAEAPVRTLGASWVEDNIVQLHAGLVEIPLHPQGIQPARDPALLRAFVNLTLISDGAEQPAGIPARANWERKAVPAQNTH